MPCQASMSVRQNMYIFGRLDIGQYHRSFMFDVSTSGSKTMKILVILAVVLVAVQGKQDDQTLTRLRKLLKDLATNNEARNVRVHYAKPESWSQNTWSGDESYHGDSKPFPSQHGFDTPMGYGAANGAHGAGYGAPMGYGAGNGAPMGYGAGYGAPMGYGAGNGAPMGYGAGNGYYEHEDSSGYNPYTDFDASSSYDEHYPFDNYAADYYDDEYDEGYINYPFTDVLDFKQLVVFPGSDYLEQLIKLHLSDFWSESVIEEFSGLRPDQLVSFESEMKQLMKMFPEAWDTDTLSLLLTRRITKALMEMRTRCPSTFIDMAMEGTLMMSKERGFTPAEGPMFTKLNGVFTRLGLSEEDAGRLYQTLITMVHDAMFRTSLEILFGGSFIDVANATHELYSTINEWFRTGMTGDFATLVNEALHRAGVKCPDATTLIRRHLLVAQLFMEDFSYLTPREVCYHLRDFIDYNPDITSPLTEADYSENDLRTVCRIINEYFERIANWFQSYELHLQFSTKSELLDVFSTRLNEEQMEKVRQAFEHLDWSQQQTFGYHIKDVLHDQNHGV